ncbi:hypothetical protein [Sedimenticola hydrogenitrophicus]|uniref:hypothetical protein n=1 Tax=Sedimenticola hydrogenitrophicus TaxID=2967975 RepID=UPI0021A81374|nr:hypothetical protein [Sedimenticola hydrogenitrophicus]
MTNSQPVTIIALKGELVMDIKAVVVVGCLLAFPLYGFGGEILSGSEIKQTFSGKTVDWENPGGSKSGKSYFSEDGTITVVKNGEKDPFQKAFKRGVVNQRTGGWSISGDNLCFSWKGCLAIEADGNGGYYELQGGSKRKLHYKNIAHGNTLQ